MIELHHYGTYLIVLLTVSQVYPISPLISFVVVFDHFFCPAHPDPLLCPGESTKCFCWCSCSVLSGGILHVGTMLCCCWRWREAERIIPDDRGIKCVAGRWRPELMLSCLFWFSTSSEAVPSKLSGSSQYSERCAFH